MSTRPLAFTNARIVDPSSDFDGTGTLLVKDGIIESIETSSAPESFSKIDCRDRVIIPGVIDMQVRTGEPGNEHEETLQSASKAAVAGGVTTMVTSPETDPVIDDIALVEFIMRNAQANASNKVHVMGALTKGLEGKEMSELRLMHSVGAVGFTNGKKSISNASIMRRALSYAKDFDGLIVHHVEDHTLTVGGVMNEGEMATRLGLPGIPKAAEVIMLERDIRLAELSSGRYHAASISCAESVEVVRKAKARGINVTCGASFKNLCLNETDIGAYRTFFKLSPPLRLEEDRQAVIEGVRDGTVDIIHSDHDPRDVDEKRHPFADAADGAVGLETLLPAILRLVHAEDLTLQDVVRVLSNKPAELLRLQTGRLAKGKPADFTILDIDEPWILEEQHLRSRSKNTAFEKARFTGRIRATYVDGKLVYEAD